MFYLIPIVLIVALLSSIALFISALVFYLKKQNAQKIDLFVNGKKVKTITYDDPDKIKFPKNLNHLKWYFNSDYTSSFFANKITTPVFELYAKDQEKLDLQAKPAKEKPQLKQNNQFGLLQSAPSKKMSGKLLQTPQSSVAVANEPAPAKGTNPPANSAGLKTNVQAPKPATSTQKPVAPTPKPVAPAPKVAPAVPPKTAPNLPPKKP